VFCVYFHFLISSLKMLLISALLRKVVDLIFGGDTFLTLVCFLTVLLMVRLAQVYVHIKKLPPGPWGVPFLGFLPYLSAMPHLQFTNMSKKYGSTFSTRLGSQLLVVLSDYKSIRMAFRKEEFSGRPVNEISSIIEGYGEYSLFYC